MQLRSRIPKEGNLPQKVTAEVAIFRLKLQTQSIKRQKWTNQNWSCNPVLIDAIKATDNLNDHQTSAYIHENSKLAVAPASRVIEDNNCHYRVFIK